MTTLDELPMGGCATAAAHQAHLAAGDPACENLMAEKPDPDSWECVTTFTVRHEAHDGPILRAMVKAVLSGPYEAGNIGPVTTRTETL